jgi:hypothetical protein
MRSVSNDSCMIYTIKQVECEICKQVLPDYVKYKGKLYEIWEFVKPNFKNYVSLETLITDRHALKNLYLINLDSKNTLRIGRSHDADLRLTDISVSRFHAQIIRNSDDTLRIEDNNSKFGSLVLLQHPKVSVNSDQSLSLQIGRSLLIANTRKPFRLFSCFSCGEVSYKEVDYSTLNEGYIEVDKILSVKVQNDKEEDSSFNSVSAGTGNKNKGDVNITDEENNNYNFNISQNNLMTSNNEIDDVQVNNDKNFMTEMNLIANGDNCNINTNEVNNAYFHRLSSTTNINHFIPNNLNELNTLNYIGDNDILVDKRDTTFKPAENNSPIIDLIKTKGINISASPTPSNKKRDTSTGIRHHQRNSMMNNIKQDRKASCLNFNHRKLSEVNSNVNSPYSPIKLNLDAFKKYEEDIVNNEVEDIIGAGRGSFGVGAGYNSFNLGQLNLEDNRLSNNIRNYRVSKINIIIYFFLFLE